MYQFYADQGLCVIPMSDKGKPLTKWSAYHYSLPTQSDCKEWSDSGFKGYSLICGKVSNVVALDIDDNSLIPVVERLIGKSPCVKVGSKGYTGFYRYNGEKTIKWCENGKAVLELLSDRANTTIPPTPHRITGVPYIWQGSELGACELPFLPDDFTARMDAYFGKKAPIKQKLDIPFFNFDRVTYDEIEKAIYYISPNCPRDEWVQIGMALQNELGDSGYELWHKWSSGGKTYDIRTAQQVYRSFDADCGVTIATLFHYAKQGGYIKSIEVVSKPEKPQIKKDIQKETVKNDILVVGGLVGAIQKWILRTAWREQPDLALGAAITIVGFFKSQNYCIAGSPYPSLYTLLVADSTSGKESVNSSIRTILKQMNLSDKSMPLPASGKAFVEQLEDRHGHAFLSVDEIGQFFLQITKSNNTNVADVSNMLIQSFTAQNSYIQSTGRARSAGEAVATVKSPRLSLLGATNGKTLRDSFTGKDVSSGLLGRFLFFQSKSFPMKKQFMSHDPSEKCPDSIINYLKRFYLNKEQIIITPSKEIIELIRQKDLEIEQTIQKERPFNKNIVIKGRILEMVLRIIVVLCDDNIITKEIVDLAFDIVTRSNNQMLEFSETLAENSDEQDYVDIKEYIKDHSPVEYRVLARKFQRVRGGTKRIKEIIEILGSNEIISIDEKKTRTRSQIVLTYVNQ